MHGIQRSGYIMHTKFTIIQAVDQGQAFITKWHSKKRVYHAYHVYHHSSSWGEGFMSKQHGNTPSYAFVQISMAHCFSMARFLLQPVHKKECFTEYAFESREKVCKLFNVPFRVFLSLPDLTLPLVFPFQAPALFSPRDDMLKLEGRMEDL